MAKPGVGLDNRPLNLTVVTLACMLLVNDSFGKRRFLQNKNIFLSNKRKKGKRSYSVNSRALFEILKETLQKEKVQRAAEQIYD